MASFLAHSPRSLPAYATHAAPLPCSDRTQPLSRAVLSDLEARVPKIADDTPCRETVIKQNSWYRFCQRRAGRCTLFQVTVCSQFFPTAFRTKTFQIASS
ncbi:hypothetical protein B0H12DRAFT_312772 [Mycena haematopus]|nr:hypothetical protein B0H12DRAFT_312772 [Mycena haematopus]